MGAVVFATPNAAAAVTAEVAPMLSRERDPRGVEEEFAKELGEELEEEVDDRRGTGIDCDTRCCTDDFRAISACFCTNSAERFLASAALRMFSSTCALCARIRGQVVVVKTISVTLGFGAVGRPAIGGPTARAAEVAEGGTQEAVADEEVEDGTVANEAVEGGI